jgi:hypothetical protein
MSFGGIFFLENDDSSGFVGGIGALLFHQITVPGRERRPKQKSEQISGGKAFYHVVVLSKNRVLSLNLA